MMRKSILLLTALLACGSLCAQKLTQDGTPVAGIVVAENADATEQYAAKELQLWLKQITGAELPIAAKAEPGKTALVVGGGLKDFPEDVKAIGETDGFAVRKNGDVIHISGNRPKGTLHAVYAFLEENTDIIWLRPNPDVGTIYSNIPTLELKNTSFRSVPKSRLRGIGFTVHGHRTEPFWAARNRMNYHGGWNKKTDILASDFPMAGGGHGLRMHINPKKYFETHPEYFVMLNGERVRQGQLCFTNTDFYPEYMKNLREHLDERPKVRGVNISIEDSWTVCCCPKCLAPLKLADGKVLDSKHPQFRSAQFFLFLNEIARQLRTTHPQIVILTYAYFFTMEPPPFPVEDNIRIMYCPYDKDNKVSYEDLNRNGTVARRLVSWGKMSDKILLREYYGCAAKFPRPIEEIMKADFLFCLKNNVMELNTEWPVDHSSAIPVWDASAITAWCMARLWWDPTADVDALRDHFITRTYREAAPAMKRYYSILQKNWYASSYPTIYMDEASTMAQMYIYEAGSEDACRAALQEAAKTAVHPISKELIKRHIETFEQWMENAKKGKRVTQGVPRLAGASMDPDAECWKSAAKLSSFLVHGTKDKPAKFRTDVSVLHDNESIYFLFDCFADDMKTLEPSKLHAGGGETFPRGDIMEFFLADAATGIYFQFALDAGNKAVYDGKIFDGKWNSSDWKRNVRSLDDRWQAVVRIPFRMIDLDPAKSSNLLFLPVRGKYYDTEVMDKKTKKMVPRRVREMSSWGGGTVHEASSFGILTLK